MALAFENDHSHQDKAREALVDINTEPTPPAEPGSDVKPRRKRLSDVQESPDGSPSESAPQPESKRKRLSDVQESLDGPPSESAPQPESKRKRLSDVQESLDGPPSESAPQPESKRKRLSGVQESPDGPPSESAPQPESKPQRPRLSVVERADQQDGSEEPKPASCRAKLSMSPAQTAVLEAPDDAEPPQAQDGAPVPTDSGKTTPTPLDPAKIEQWIAGLRARQSLLLAAGGGVLAAVVGALIWAVISVLTQYFSWIAIGAALLVGGVVRVFGRGLDRQFGYLGAALSLCSCILGNYLANCMFIAREVNLSFASVLTQIDPAAVPRLLTATFRPADVVFYGLAVYLGYYFSFHRITEAQIRRAFDGK